MTAQEYLQCRVAPLGTSTISLYPPRPALGLARPPRLNSLTRPLRLWLQVRLRQQQGGVRAQQKTEGKEDSEAGIALLLAAFLQICSDRLHPWVKLLSATLPT